MRLGRIWGGAAVLAAATAVAVGLAGTAQAGPITWQEEKLPDLGTGGGLSALDALSAEDVWAVGNTGPKGDRKGLVRNWDGAQWQELALPDTVTTLSDVRAFAADDVWTVGSRAAHHYDGATWTTHEVPMPADGAPWLMAVDGVSGADLWAVGNTGVVGGGPDGYAFLEHFDGAKWSRVEVPVPAGVTQFNLRQVYAAAADDVWAVGSVFVDGIEKPLLTHYDGTGWKHEDPAGLPEGAGTGVAMLDGQLWMVGFGGTPNDPFDAAPMLLHRDGDAWVAVDTPKDVAWLYNVTPDGNGGLIAGGYTQRGTAVLRFDGATATLETGPMPGDYGSVDAVTTVPGTATVWAVGQTGSQPWSVHT